MAKLKKVTDCHFASEVLQEQVPLVVDFWAPSSGACRRVAPMLEELAHEYGDKAKFLSMNTAHNTDTTRDYRIWAVPALLVFKDGQPVGRAIGFRAKDDLKNFIEHVLRLPVVEPEEAREARLREQREIIRRHRSCG